jgi:RNA polymerase sigma-70 factor (sigma-E family)
VNSLTTVERRRVFEDVVREQGTALARLAFFLCRDKDTAEDLAAEALARTWPRWRDAQVDDLGPYLRRVTVNLAQKVRHRKFLAARYERQFDAMMEIEDTQGAVSLRVDLVRPVMSLPTPQRAVIVLRYLEDLSEAEVAELLGISIGTVKSRASRGLGALKKLYGGGFDA